MCPGLSSCLWRKTAILDSMRGLIAGVAIFVLLVDVADAAGVAADSAADSPPAFTIAQFRAAPPIGQIARIVGYVVHSYRCPPCPKGAQCKPCATASAIFIADAPSHAPFALDAPPADVAAVAAQDPDRFERGIPYRFEIAVADRRHERLDGRLLRSQHPDRAPAWTDDGQ